jgi:hypothetical protein
MPLLDDGRDLKVRFGAYIEQFQQLLREHRVKGSDWLANLRSASRDPKFKARCSSIWNEILEEEGGKVALPVILGIVGAVLGGIGIAGFGGAIGVPLAMFMVPLGLVLGNEFDAEGTTRGIIRKIRHLCVGHGSEDSRDDAWDSADEVFAALLELAGETTSRFLTLERQNTTLRTEVAKLTDQVSSLKYQLETSQAEIGNLQQRVSYLGWGILLLGITSISGLLWLFLH